MAEHDALGGFVPFNDAHAIVASSVTVQFAAPIPDEARPNLRSKVHALGREMGFGIPAPFYNTSVTFDSSRVGVFFNYPTAGIVETSGLSFGRLDEDGVAVERFTSALDHIHIMTNSYIRWGPFFKKASEFIERIYDVYADNLVFAATKVEYWDRFDFRSDGQPSIKALIRPSCPWLSSSLTEESEGAHCHSGRFDRLDDKLRRLTNVRVDYGDYPGRDGVNTRSAIIYTMLQDAANAPGYAETGRNAYTAADVLCMLDKQHLALKDLLRDIITEQAAARIGL